MNIFGLRLEREREVGKEKVLPMGPFFFFWALLLMHETSQRMSRRGWRIFKLMHINGIGFDKIPSSTGRLHNLMEVLPVLAIGDCRRFTKCPNMPAGFRRWKTWVGLQFITFSRRNEFPLTRLNFGFVSHTHQVFRTERKRIIRI